MFIVATLDYSVIWGPFESATLAADWARRQTGLPPWLIRFIREPK